MARTMTVAAAQLGPIPRADDRKTTVDRLIVHLEKAASLGADLVVFPEAALTAFFPHWYIDDDDELDAFFERAMPNADVQPLFDAAARLRVGFHLGYCELDGSGADRRRFNTAILVGRDGQILGKYRKIHLPGHREHRPQTPFQNLEQRYFAVGDLGFRSWDFEGVRIGIMICNDRRWPEAYRALALGGAELVAIGYNTPVHNPAMPDSDRLVDFHNHLSMQAGAYQHSLWVVGVAKAGTEEGVEQIGGSCVIAPSGEIVARCEGLADELIVHSCDLELAARYRRDVFNPDRNRQPQHYGALTELRRG